MKLLGLDPGLQNTGWGIILVEGNHLSFVDGGTVRTDKSLSLAERLLQLHEGLRDVITQYQPTEAAVEETFVNKNPNSTLKLGQARGIALLVPAQHGLPVAEYTPNLVKKTVVGSGHAAKEQIQMMVKIILPSCRDGLGPDAADALAVAICHAHHRQTSDVIAKAIAGGTR
ncbi:MAG: crossover junction endodeoxyribonuclease RuvC [Rhodospirillales bacterium]|jgi:crossover junction endodeoxyribonuclease RuvC|nr:crossover junction endodeoxyribonuclease RuvC [Rhodospirillales bacterium]